MNEKKPDSPRLPKRKRASLFHRGKSKQNTSEIKSKNENYRRNRSETIDAFSKGDLDLKGLLDKHKTPLKPKESHRQASRLIPVLSNALQNTACLAYFIEYLQLKLVKDVLDFWLAVEGFKAVAKQRIKRKSFSSTNHKDRAKDLKSSLELEMTCAELETLCMSTKDRSTSSPRRPSQLSNDKVEHSSSNNGDHLKQIQFRDEWRPFNGDASERKKNDSQTTENIQCDRQTKGEPSSETGILGDAVGIYERFLALDAPFPVTLPVGLRQKTEGNLCENPDEVDPECFASAQSHAYSELEKHYSKFLCSNLGRKYQLNVIRTNKLTLMDIVYDTMALFYFTEFMERQGGHSILEFWLTAENFEKELEKRLLINLYDIDECLEDAMTIYDKYFSMRSQSRLIVDDKLRIVLENNICRVDGPQPNCFCIPMAYAWTALNEIYFPRFIKSEMYIRYQKDLEKGSEGLLDDDESVTSSEATASTNAAMAASNSEWDLLDMDSEAIWQRAGTGRLAMGHVDIFGNFHSESEPEPHPKSKASRGAKGSKFRSAIKRFIANEPEDYDEEQLAMERAQKIIEDVKKLNNLS